MHMASTQSGAENDRKRLRAARGNISPVYTRVKNQRSAYNTVVKAMKWKGDRYNSIVKKQDLDGAFGRWLWRAGWSDDGSIDGAIDKLNREIDGLTGFIQSFFNN